MMCGTDISQYNLQRKMQHLHRCAEKIPRDGDGMMTGERYACVLCKFDLSSSDTASRINHIKKCALKKGVSVTEMGKIMAESKLEDRMPRNIASARPKAPPTIPGAPKSANEERLQLAMAISASEKPLEPLESQFSSGGLSLDSQHDLAGFRMSQHHSAQRNQHFKPSSSTASQLAKLPFEDEDALASQIGSDEPPVMAIPSALASKYSRQGGSPRKKNLWSLQGMDSVAAFGSSPTRSSPVLRRVIPSTVHMENDNEPAVVLSPQLSPVKRPSSGDALPMGTMAMSQTGGGAVDALVDLFDEEDALEDRDASARRRLEFDLPDTSDDVPAPSQVRKKRNRSSQTEIHMNQIECDEEPVPVPKRSKPTRSVPEPSSSRADTANSHLSSSSAATSGDVSPALETAVIEVVQASSRRSQELKRKFVREIQRIQSEYYAEVRLQNCVLFYFFTLTETGIVQLDRISQDKDAQINRLLNAHSSSLSLQQRIDVRQRAEADPDSVVSTNPLTRHPLVVDYNSAINWGEDMQAPPDTRGGHTARSDAINLVSEHPTDVSIAVIDTVGLSDSSPEFKTPPPRMPAPRRGPVTPQDAGLDDSIFEPHLNLESSDDNRPHIQPSAGSPEGSVIYSSSSPPASVPPTAAMPESPEVSFSKLSLAELKILGANFGIKPTLSKQHIIDQLERIRRAEKSAQMSPRTAEAAELQRAGLLASPAPVPSQASQSQRGGLEMVYTRNNSSDQDLHNRMVQSIRSDPTLWARILKFQVVEVEDVKGTFLRSRIKVSKEFIKDFCVTKGVNLAKVQRTKD
jgi:hypothetical protein